MQQNDKPRWYELWKKWTKSASLTRQWGVAVLFTMLPLFLAVAYAVYSLDRQNQGQLELVSNVVKLSQLGVQIEEDIREQERVTRQQQILKNEQLRIVSGEKLEKLRVKLGLLSDLLAEEMSTQRIGRLVLVLQEMHEQSNQSTSTAELLDEKYSLANSLNTSLRKDIKAHIESALQSSEREFQDRKHYLLLMGSLVLPVTILFLGFFSYRISSPLKSLAGVIRRLGQGAVYEPVNIDGPDDITELVNRLEWMREKMLDLEKQKNVFLRHVTHELKTPLAAIMEAVSLMQDEVPGPINKQQKNVLTILEKNAKSLLEQIQQLLNYNEARGMIGSKGQLVALQPFFSSILKRQRDMADARKVRLKLSGADSEVPIDALRVEMVLSNLLSNAVNFSPSNSEVRLCWGVRNNELWFTVEDQGPGIQLVEGESIFQPFFQGSARRVGSTKGSGLGLSIAKECVQTMQGKISFENKLTQGALFKVLVPLKDVMS